MNPANWQRVREELGLLLELPQAQQAEQLVRLRAEDPSLAQELDSLLGASANDTPFLEPPSQEQVRRSMALNLLPAALPNAAPPELIGAWRVVAEIGRGGMGMVYLAERDDAAFQQRVAIKLVRPELASELLRRRFLAERRILAGLDHPNIAHLLDGGTTAEGAPYLVLEYVAGLTIDRYCDDKRLPIEERLRLFVQVCGAVHHAHQKLVLHRDIKAANILVTAAGAPKLLDFGIAKLLSPEPGEAELTSFGFARPLTPEWASPEQLRGEELSTASDVYSLGVLLFALLTGRRPHHNDKGTTDSLAAMIENSPAPALDAAAPGVERARLRGDLVWITHKALAPQPGQRYATAAALAADVERFLSSSPVEAHPPAVGYFFGKFVRRNRAAVAALAVAAASLVIATGVSLREASIAQRERTRAELRFNDVRRLANVVLFDLSSALENVSGALVARRLLVENALKYLDDLAREAGDEPSLLEELSVAYERVAELQGMPGWPSEGRTGDSRASLDQALALRRRAAAHAPASPASRSAEARVVARLGTVLSARGEMAAAIEKHREAEAILIGIGSLPTDQPRRQELAIVQVALGDDAWDLGDLAGAEQHYSNALSTSRETMNALPDSVLAIRQVGVVEQRLGDVAAQRQDLQEALKHHRASLAIDEELLRREPANAELQRDLGTDLSRVGSVALELGSAAEALAAHVRARDMRERLLAAEPGDARALEDAAESRFQAAKALAQLGCTSEALAEAVVAIERWRALVRLDSANVHWCDALATGLTGLGRWQAAEGASSAALASLSEALELRQALATEHPDLSANIQTLPEATALLAAMKAGEPLPPPLRSVSPWH